MHVDRRSGSAGPSKMGKTAPRWRIGYSIQTGFEPCQYSDSNRLEDAHTIYMSAQVDKLHALWKLQELQG